MSEMQIKTTDNLGRLNKALLKAKKSLDKTGIEYFPMTGVLLGLIRDGSIIKWDSDIDIGSMADTTKKEVRDKIVKCLREDYKSVGMGPDWGWGEEAYRCGFITTGEPSNAMQFFKDMGDYVAEVSTKVRYPPEPFRKFKTIKYLGKEFMIPDPPEKLLEFWYGKHWQTPARHVYVKESMSELYEYQEMGYRRTGLRHVSVECDTNGKIIYPLNVLGFTIRDRVIQENLQPTELKK